MYIKIYVNRNVIVNQNFLENFIGQMFELF